MHRKGSLLCWSRIKKDTVLFCNCRQQTAPPFHSAVCASRGLGLPHCLSTTLICGCITQNSLRHLGGNWRVRGLFGMRLDAMNIQMNQLAQSARDESLCESCGRRWFGLVAYCPYCGRKPRLTTEAPGALPRSDDVFAGEQGTLGLPDGGPLWQDPESPRNEPNATVGPTVGATVPVQRDSPAASQSSKPSWMLLFTTILVAGISAVLLVWMLVKLPVPNTNEQTSPPLATPSSGTTAPRQGPPTRAAQAPPIPPRTDTAVPARPKRSPCSVAHEAAGLCKSQD
jgi:hypothetical protein